MTSKAKCPSCKLEGFIRNSDPSDKIVCSCGQIFKREGNLIEN